MRLVTQTEVLGDRLGEEKAVRMLCEAGFDALDYSMFRMSDPADTLNQDTYREHVKTLKDIAASYGVEFVQAHAPFPSYREGNPAYNETTFAQIIRSIEISAIMGVKILVVHPIALADPMQNQAFNLEFYKKLEPYAKEYGVKIALENMWGWDDAAHKICPNVCSTGETFAAYMDELDPRYFTACLDLGHCGLVGDNAPDMIRALGHDHLKALHVHDNDNVHDSHTAPYLGDMDWAGITAALAEIRYDGEFTFEADNFFGKLPLSVLPDAVKLLHGIGRDLIEQIRAGGETA